MNSHSAAAAAAQAESDDPLVLSPVLLQELRRALRSLRYGAIELVIHDGRVVQLERREKVHFDIELTATKSQR